MAVLRKIFLQRETIEVPPFPAPLVESWCHPDLYLALSGSRLASCYAFQTFANPGGFLADQQVKTPDLIWLADRGGSQFSRNVRELLLKLQKELLPDREDAVFAVVADSRRKLNCGEVGSAWKIRFAGVECGQMLLYSAIPGSILPEAGATVVVLQLNTLAALLEPAALVQPALWADKVAVAGSLAVHAWQNTVALPDVNLDEVRLQVEKASAASEKETAATFCLLLRLYNQHFRSINQSNDVYQLFAQRLGQLSEKLLAAQASSANMAVAAAGDCDAL